MADLESLLKPIDGDNPAGPDLSYDDKRLEIEQAFEAASTIEPGEGDSIDWRNTISLILDQGERTRDVWLPVYLMRAAARANRLDTLELGSQYLAGLFEQFWPTMHPTLDEYGFQGRKGPCESLTRIAEFIGPLKRMAFVEHGRLGSFTGDDLERFARDGDSADGYGMFRAAMDELPADELQATLDRLGVVRESIQRVDTALSANADGDTGTNFATTYAAIDAIRRGLALFGGVADDSPPAPEASSDAPRSVDSSPSGGGARLGGAIESREDVLKALDAIIDYYRRREPGSAVPIAIGRAKGWVSMDFLAVLEDIAPDSVRDARRVLSSQQEDE